MQPALATRSARTILGGTWLAECVADGPDISARAVGVALKDLHLTFGLAATNRGIEDTERASAPETVAGLGRIEHRLPLCGPGASGAANRVTLDVLLGVA